LARREAHEGADKKEGVGAEGRGIQEVTLARAPGCKATARAETQNKENSRRPLPWELGIKEDERKEGEKKKNGIECNGIGIGITSQFLGY
jgi:hypothetical protein